MSDEVLEARSREDETFMRRCLDLAREASARGETGVGALLVRDSSVIAEAGEATRGQIDPSAHAEVQAIRIACRQEQSTDLSGCTLYTTVEPCVLCGYVIRRAGIARVVYGVAAGQAGAVTSQYSILSDSNLDGWPPIPRITHGVLADECQDILKHREAVVLSWSGGKDSSLALAELRSDPRYRVVALLTSITRGYDRVSIHGVRRELVEAQAVAAGLPLIEVTLDPQSSNEAYEAAFRNALARVRADYPSVKKIAFGDLFLADVREYREKLVSASGFEALFPLWGRDTRQLAEEFIAAGFSATIVCVDTTQLLADFAGRTFDTKFLDALPASVDPCGERGEFHTFVSSGPVFANPIAVRCGELVLRDDRFMFCDVLVDD